MNETQNRIMEDIAAKCVQDPDFRARLLAAPEAVMRTLGLPLPADQRVEAIHDEGQEIRLVFHPRANELSDTQLDQVAGGGRFTVPNGGDDMYGKTVLVFLKPQIPQRSYKAFSWGSVGDTTAFDYEVRLTTVV